MTKSQPFLMQIIVHSSMTINQIWVYVISPQYVIRVTALLHYSDMHLIPVLFGFCSVFLIHVSSKALEGSSKIINPFIYYL